MSCTDAELRWDRAAAWACGQSFGPYVHGIDEEECKRIEALRDLMLELDPDDATERRDR